MQIPTLPASITELGKLYRSGAVTPVEIVQQALARIDRLDPGLNSYLTVVEDRALEQAARAEKEFRAGHWRGPLHGVPYAAKDLLETRGIRTTVGSALRADNVSHTDAAIIERLDEAGAILLGKTGLHEWAYGITSTNPHFGPIRNPWDPERIPGGSSGGSAAAQAASLCIFSLGSDTGGSIRIPAALCGIAGLKPTFGRVSRRGAFPLGHTLDTMGPFGSCVKDTALVYMSIAGHDALDPVSSTEPVEGLRWQGRRRLDGVVIGVPDHFYFDNLAPDIDSSAQAALRALAELGAELREVKMPDIEMANSLHRIILLAEASSVHHRLLERHRDAFGDDVRALLDQGSLVSAMDYINAQRARRVFCRRFGAAMESVDALVAPTVPIPTARIGELEVEVNGRAENVRLATTRNVRALNLTGLPVVSVPCGFDRDGMPIGLQIVGKKYSEKTILAIAAAYERATTWHLRLSPMARESPTDTPQAGRGTRVAGRSQPPAASAVRDRGVH